MQTDHRKFPAMTTERIDIAVPQNALDDLSDRIARTRWPDQISGSGWDYGTDTAYLKGLLSYWRDGFNWRKREERINRFEHFRTMIDGLQIHFIHAKSRSGRAIHLLLLHGWPSSFLQMLDILPMLTNPPSGDGPDFEVIVPSLPGFGSSPAPDTRGLNERTCASIFVHLMHDVLGFVRFAARGSDIGASILQHLARDPPQRLLGLHLTGICPIVGDIPVDATARELEFVNEARIVNGGVKTCHGAAQKSAS